MNAVVKIKPLLFHLALPVVLGFLSSRLSGNVRQVYESLALPPFAPPGALFPVVWVLLYLLMGIAAYLVFNGGGLSRGDRAPVMALYGMMLLINFMWSPLFFRFRLFTVAAWWIVLLLCVTLLCAAVFFRIRKAAGLLLLPTIAWLVFAGVLNFYVAALN